MTTPAAIARPSDPARPTGPTSPVRLARRPRRWPRFLTITDTLSPRILADPGAWMGALLRHARLPLACAQTETSLRTGIEHKRRCQLRWCCAGTFSAGSPSSPSPSTGIAWLRTSTSGILP